MVGRCEIKIEQPKKGCDQPFGLVRKGWKASQTTALSVSERKFVRLVSVRLPPPARAGLSSPHLDLLIL